MTEKILRFSEREGLKSLPIAYKLGELPNEVRNEIKSIVIEIFGKFSNYYRGDEVLPDWNKIFKDFHVKFLDLPIEAFYRENTESQLFGLISVGSYDKVLDALEFFINHRDLLDHSLRNELSELFERRQVAYILIERDKNKRIFVPRASREEGDAYRKALDVLYTGKFAGARKSLIEAGYELSKKKYDNSVRESIHAVESMIRVLTENEKIKFSDGMRDLGRKFSLHGALIEGFIRFYGFTSDAEGVRHSSIEGTESIDEETAFYFLGSCSSFVTYLIHKANKASSKTV